MKNLSSLLTRREVAELLRVTPRTIHTYERAGKLKPVRLSGRAVRYRRSEVEAFIGA